MSDSGVNCRVRQDPGDWRKDAAALCSFAAVAAFMTWPAVTLFDRVYGQRGDAMGTIWWLWWQKFAGANGIPVNPVAWIAAPFGRTIDGHSRDVLSSGVLRVMTRVTNETVAYNLFLIASFFLAAASMYFLVRRLTGKRTAAAISGLVFGFSPYMLMHGKEHITLLTTATIPLFFYFLIRSLSDRTPVMYLLCAASFALMTLFNYHYGLIGGVMALAFLASLWMFGRPWRHPRSAGALVPLAVVLVLAGGAVLIGFTRGGFGQVDLRAEYLYSARPWDYFVPHAEAWLLGPVTRGFIYSHLHGGFVSESSLFPGFVPLALASLGLIGSISRNRTGQVTSEAGVPGASNDRGPEIPAGWIPAALGTCAVVCFLLSMPPTTTLLGRKIYLPSYLLHYLVPDVRAYARFGVGVLFCVAVLAGYGVKALLRGKWFSRNRVLLTAVLALVLLLEFAIVPPFRSLDTGTIADHYVWLRDNAGSSVIAVYPLFYADDFQGYRYNMDQRHHRKKMVNGAEPYSKAELYRQSALDITDPSTPRILRSLGVGYVLVIPSLYLEGRHVNYVEPQVFERDSTLPGLSEVERFEDGIIYRLTAPPADFVGLFTSGAGQPVIYSDGVVWHPLKRTATLEIESALKAPATVDVSFSARTVKGAGRLTVAVNGKAASGALTLEPGEVVLRSVLLRPGGNVLTIEADAPTGEVQEVPGATFFEAAVMLSGVDIDAHPLRVSAGGP